MTGKKELLTITSEDAQEYVKWAKNHSFCNSGCHICDRLATQFEEALEIEEDDAIHTDPGNPITPEVVIEVHGGVASLTIKSKGVQVTIQDYDNTEVIDYNHDREYSEEIWDESEKI